MKNYYVLYLFNADRLAPATAGFDDFDVFCNCLIRLISSGYKILALANESPFSPSIIFHNKTDLGGSFGISNRLRITNDFLL